MISVPIRLIRFASISYCCSSWPGPPATYGRRGTTPTSPSMGPANQATLRLAAAQGLVVNASTESRSIAAGLQSFAIRACGSWPARPPGPAAGCNAAPAAAAGCPSALRPLARSWSPSRPMGRGLWRRRGTAAEAQAIENPRARRHREGADQPACGDEHLP